MQWYKEAKSQNTEISVNEKVSFGLKIGIG